MHRIHLFSSVIFLANLLSVIYSDEILGCGGFIKSHADIDFSKVEIKLFTKQGSLKDKTDCSPSNGYYFLPVYDKGEYYLKISPPPGWSFEPERIDINFDGKTDICSVGKDVNFSFKGFGITGRIFGPDKASAVKDVSVELRPINGDEVRRANSDLNGVFSFTPVIPGQYVVKVQRSGLHFEKSEFTVTVTAGNTELPKEAFIVSGYNVQGKINDGNRNFEVLLFSAKNQKRPLKCRPASIESSTAKSNNAGYEDRAACGVVPAQNGQYDLNGVAPGKYLLRLFSQNKNIKFHIQPDVIEFEVQNGPVIVKQIFEITGFSVFGRVLTKQNGFGVANAKVFLNGEHVTTAHTDGSYTLNNIKAGTFKITAEAQDVQFTETVVTISPENPTIPDIIASAYKVCGQVLSEDSYTIAITRHSSTYHTQATSVKDTGEWCTYLAPGRYAVQILTSADDSANGIQFFPKIQNIDVSTSPVEGITFSQLKATVTGDVKCLTDPEGSTLCQATTVTLHALDSDGKRSGQSEKTNVKNDKYSFVDIRPGTYELSVPSNLLCWESNTLTLNVKSASETVPTFVHNGYLVSITSSHSTKMTYKLRSKAPQAEKDIILTPGPNSFCVEQFGVYDLTFTGCHVYDKSSHSSFQTGEEKSITVTALKHRNGVKILSDIRSTHRALVENNGEKKSVIFTEETEKENGRFSYRYDFDLKHQERIIITPESEIVLFSPTSSELIGADDCVENALTFNAAKGLIINGKITPPIADVRVILKFPQNPDVTSLETITASNGQFKFGPLDSQLAVELVAEKESYVFSNFDSARSEFKAHKLCEIIATVKDEQGNLLSGVLLSLSGAESYRKNLVTGDDGTIKFHSLSPSQYYLRPMMKEYRFDPTSKMIDIKDGETIRVELNGKRVSFSAFGLVQSLNGEPFPSVTVEARSEERCGNHQEEATTEPNGQYRIRGLQPNCVYTIRVRNYEQSALVDRTVPIERKVTVTKDDVHSVNIIAISPLTYVDVITRVYAGTNEHYKTLRVQLYKKDDGSSDTPIHSLRVESPLNVKSRVNPGIMVFFPRVPFDGKTYVVELTSTLSDKNFKYTVPSQSFQANRSTIYVELHFDPEIRLNENDLNQNSISALILLGLIVVAFFKQDLATELLGLAWNKVSILATTAINNAQKRNVPRHDTTYNENEIERLAQSINATKKKNVRKT